MSGSNRLFCGDGNCCSAVATQWSPLEVSIDLVLWKDSKSPRVQSSAKSDIQRKVQTIGGHSSSEAFCDQIAVSTPIPLVFNGVARRGGSHSSGGLQKSKFSSTINHS
jgi:hypothetical protein